MMTLKKWIKSALGFILFETGLARLFFRNKAVITYFHRVDDRLKGDELSCTVAEFRSYLSFFKSHFNVISLPELLRRMQCGEDISRCLVITFDDGYRDNYENAANELKRFGLPACFFVSTGFVETDKVAWWDKELPFRLMWMNWDEVRALAREGFDIGAHTINHIDMGVVDRQTAVAEVQGSKTRLEQELGMNIDLFAYPYGQPEQITEENRQVVRELGLRCCVSAFGGVVAPTDEPFQLKRQPVSVWFVSPYQFGFETALGKS